MLDKHAKKKDKFRLAVLFEVLTNGGLIGQMVTTQLPLNSLQPPPSLEIPKNGNLQQLQEYRNLIDQISQNLNVVQAQMAIAKLNFTKNKPILSQGLIGLGNASQSGYSKCTFNNNRLFILER